MSNILVILSKRRHLGASIPLLSLHFISSGMQHSIILYEKNKTYIIINIDSTIKAIITVTMFLVITEAAEM